MALLACLLLLLVLSPSVEGSLFGHFALDAILGIVMVICVLEIDARWSARLVVIAVGVFSLALQWSSPVTFDGGVRIAGLGLYLLLIAVAFYNIMKFIVQAKIVDAAVILHAISAYLLIGVMWTLIFMIIHLLDPTAFGFDPFDRYHGWTKYLYLSLTTLTTLGYGDITSSNPIVQIWSVLEAIVGVFFQAILIARLVSMYRSAD